MEHYHADTYLSLTDDNYWQDYPAKPDRPETWKDYDITVYVQDGDTITLGDDVCFPHSIPSLFTWLSTLSTRDTKYWWIRWYLSISGGINIVDNQAVLLYQYTFV